jgi:hypothetical protein
VENIDNAVIVNVFAPFADYTAAGGTGGNFFCHRLIALWTKLHRLRTNWDEDRTGGMNFAR